MSPSGWTSRPICSADPPPLPHPEAPRLSQAEGEDTLAAAGTGNIGINVASGAAAHTINAPIVLGQSQTWNQSSTNTLTVGGNVSGTGTLTKRNDVPAAVAAGFVDRKIVSDMVMKDPSLLARLEKKVHAEIKNRRNEIIAEAKNRGDQIVVVDVPLLFETGSDKARRWSCGAAGRRS